VEFNTFGRVLRQAGNAFRANNPSVPIIRLQTWQHT